MGLDVIKKHKKNTNQFGRKHINAPSSMPSLSYEYFCSDPFWGNGEVLVAEFPDLEISDYGGIDAALDTMRELMLEWIASHDNFVPQPLSYDEAYSLCALRNEDIAAERIYFQGCIVLELPDTMHTS
jgi:hypothetical protein